jgi:hypothetical protein
MEIEPKKRNALVVGTLIGALLGAGAAWIIMDNPPEPLNDGKEPKPIKPTDIITLTGAAASLIRMVNDFRRRL